MNYFALENRDFSWWNDPVDAVYTTNGWKL